MARKTWSLKRTAQCAKYPWRKDVNPHDIPNGYSVEKHKALDHTISREASIEQMLSGELHIMACHETEDAHCVGWLVNQMGPGNNLGLRMALLSCDNYGRIRLRGEQHETFEDTLPRTA